MRNIAQRKVIKSESSRRVGAVIELSYRGALSLASFATNSAIASAFLSSISEETLMDLLTLD